MEDNLFDFDLNMVANSEDAIITADKSKDMVNPDPKKQEQTTTNTTNQNQPSEEDLAKMKELENPLGLSLDELANLGGEEDTESKEDKTDTPEAKAQTNASSSHISSLVTTLFEEGVLASLDEEKVKEIQDVPALIEAIKDQIKENELADLSEPQKEYLEALKAGVPLDVYKQQAADAQIYKNIKDEQIENNEQLRAALIKQNFVSKGLSDSEAIKLTAMALKSEEVVKDAIEARDNLVKHAEDKKKAEIEKAKQETLNKEKERVEKLTTLKKTIDTKTEIVPGVGFNAQTRDKIYKSITEPKGDIEGKPTNEFVHKYFTDDNFKVAVHYMDIITKGFTDFSKLKETSKSAAVKELEDKLKSTKTTTGHSGTRSSTGSGTARAIVDALP